MPWLMLSSVRQKTLVVLPVAICTLLIAVPSSPAAPRASSVSAPTDKEIIDSPLYKPSPAYPERALETNVEGRLWLKVTIAPDGRVANAEVTSAAPEGWFEKAALEAVKKWKYRPPHKEMTFEVAIEFTLP